MSLDHDTPAAIDSLLRFSQGASQPFEAYVAEFSTLLERTNTDIPATLQVVLFLNGLRSVSTRAQLLACCPETLSAAVSLARVQEEALTVPKAQSVVAAGEQVLAATKNEPDASRALKVDRLLALCEADGITDAVIDARARAGVCLWCDQPRLRKPRPAVAAPGDRMARLEDEVDAINRILRAPYGGMAMLPSRARDEVAPRLYLSEESWVLDRAALRTEGVTHILNCAEGTDRRQVNTGAEYYEGDDIEYLGLPGHDHPDFNIAELFPATNDFIAAALASSPQARVVVHCKVGASRSAAIVLAFLMSTGLTLEEAVRKVAERREISPNEGFVAQLIEHDHELALARG